MQSAADLRLDAVSCRYGEVRAVDDVTLAVPPGSYVVLLGPSGSGKTTLLSMLGGFTLPTAGRVFIGGEDVTLVPPAQRPTATVFQDYALFPHLSVGGNVGFGLSVRGVPKAQIAARVDDALRRVGLEGYGSRAIGAASGGQRQRIALARALVIEPALLLLDEPLGALDLSLRRQMQDELRRLQRAEGRTFVHVTHDQEEAMALADVMVIMNRGRIEDMGTPARLYERPRTRFAAQFLGESSILEGRVGAAAGGQLAVDTSCGRLHVPGEREVGSAVALAVRSEALRIGGVGAAAPGAQALGYMQVDERVYQGSFLRLSGTGAGGVRLLAKLPPQTFPADADSDSLPVAVCAGGLVLLED
jgi:spermidine/putrescine transport system ATP-binding protein